MGRSIKWVLDCDIQGCFDNFDHNILLSLLNRRINDKRIMQLIRQWIKAGVVDGNSLQVSKRGTPQGNIISPLLCNVYLHYALDTWLHETVRPLLKGEMSLVRYADDFIIGFENEEDAMKVNRALPKRLGKYGLTIHPEKSRLLRFMPVGDRKPPTFDFLGFTHYWGKSRKGKWVVKRKTRQKKMQAIIQKMKDTCKRHRHEKLREQVKALNQILRGLYQYYGIRGNFMSLYRMYRIALSAWFKWLNRRGQRKSYTWAGFWDLVKYFKLASPKIIHNNV
jgi:group II intron reverse transcriptase/maturase